MKSKIAALLSMVMLVSGSVGKVICAEESVKNNVGYGIEDVVVTGLEKDKVVYDNITSDGGLKSNLEGHSSLNDKEYAYTYAVENGNIYINAEGDIIGCDNTVTKVIMPNEIEGIRITGIADNVFDECKELRSIYISQWMGDIRGQLFMYNEKIEEIIVDQNNDYYCVADNMLFSKDMSCIIYSAAKTAGEIVIPDSVKYLEERSFVNTDATSIYILGQSYQEPY